MASRNLFLAIAALAVFSITASGCARRPAVVQAPAETSASTTVTGAPNPVSAQPAAEPPAAPAGATADARPQPGNPPPLTPLPEPPKPVGQPAAVPESGVRLVYKFSPGRKSYYQVALKQEMTMAAGAPGAQGGGPMNLGMGNMRSTVDGTLRVANEIKSVSAAGEAKVRSQATEGEVKMNGAMLGGELTMNLKDGKTSVLLNGQPQQGGPGAGAGGQLGRARELRVLPTGKLGKQAAGAAAAGNGMSGMMGGGIGSQEAGAYGMLVLPAKPVKPGDSWTDVQVQPLPLPGSGKSSKVTVKTVFTLKEIIQQEGKQIAVIESTSSYSMPANSLKGMAGPMKIEQMIQKVTGTSQFDVAAGELLSGHYKTSSEIRMSSNMGARRPNQAPAGTPPPQQMKMTMKSDGGVQIMRRDGP